MAELAYDLARVAVSRPLPGAGTQMDMILAMRRRAEDYLAAGHTKCAFMMYETALHYAPHDPLLRVSYARALLQAGHLEPGWREYDCRLEDIDPPAPYWDNEPLAGRTLVVTAEQDLRMQIMFASQFHALAGRVSREGGRLVIEVDPRLAPLAARTFPDLRIVTPADGWYTLVDETWLSLPMGSVFARLGAEPPAYPAGGGYLCCDGEAAAGWRAWLAGLPEGRKVGICMAAHGETAPPVDVWARLVGTRNITLVSLDREPCIDGLYVPPGLDPDADIDQAAALLHVLDYVITGPGHLAGLAASVGTGSLRLLARSDWMRLGGAFNAFAPWCEDVACAAPGDWSAPAELAETILHALSLNR